MLINREVILLKVESSYKTDSVPSGTTDAILVSELSESNEGLRMLERNNIKPSLATDQSIYAGSLKKVSFTAEIKGSGTAGVAPEIGQALRCCGLDETIVANTSVAYQPVSENHESCTIYYYQEGRMRKLLGARGTFSLNAENGAYPTIQFEFTGHDGGLVDTALPTVSYDDTVPAPFMDVNLQVDSYGAIINSISLDVSNNIIMPSDVRDKYGFGEIQITKRNPNGTLDPESVTRSTYDFEDKFKTGARMALDSGQVGSVAGNRWQLTASIALREITQGERDEKRVDELTFGCHETNGDDEFTLTFL